MSCSLKTVIHSSPVECHTRLQGQSLAVSGRTNKSVGTSPIQILIDRWRSTSTEEYSIDLWECRVKEAAAKGTPTSDWMTDDIDTLLGPLKLPIT